jgi:hypothetical protein
MDSTVNIVTPMVVVSACSVYFLARNNKSLSLYSDYSLVSSDFPYGLVHDQTNEFGSF